MEFSGAMASSKDVRVKLTCKKSLEVSLGTPIPPGAILSPLVEDAGVIFPYTPMINVAYNTNYGSHQPTHSNFQYRYFQNYSMQELTCSAEFTAATTAEARYMVASLHFFKSAMKMSFGENDPNRGVPPPVLEFSGYGPGFFEKIPVVITNLSYALDSSTDYVFARIENNNIVPMAGVPDVVGETFVPVKTTFILTLAPTYNTYSTRKDFTLADFVNGRLLRNGYS